MKKAFKKMLAVLVAVMMLVTNVAMLSISAEDGHVHAEATCPGVKAEHTAENCSDYTEVKKVEPTCEGPGYTLNTCDTCGTPFMTDIVVGAEVDHIPAEPVVVLATCESAGSTTIYCDVCDELLSTEVLPQLDHKYEADGEGCKCVNGCDAVNEKHNYVIDVETVVPPTADTDDAEGELGSATFVCEDCGHEKELIISEICDDTHEWTTVWSVDPTCTETGYTTHIYCATCDRAFGKEETAALGHAWDEENAVITKNPSCTEEGELTITCGVCGETKTETIDKEEHTWGDAPDYVKVPTCEYYGYEVYACIRCGTKGETVMLPPKGHNFKNPNGEYNWDSQLHVAPDCEAKTNGHGVANCVNGCGATEEHELPYSHTEEEIPAVEMTCTSDGFTAGKKCSVCEEVLVEPERIAAAHDYQEHTESATCVSPALTGEKCTACGEWKAAPTETGTVDPNGHEWGQEIVVPATCETTGLAKVYCTLCDAVDEEDRILPATGHNWIADESKTNIEPDCVTAGTYYWICDAGCEGEKTTNPAAQGHDLSDVATNVVGDTTYDEATCNDAGEYYYVCEREGCDHQELAWERNDAEHFNPENHAEEADFVKVLRAPTCTIEGLDLYKYPCCGADETVLVPTVEHAYTSAKIRANTVYCNVPVAMMFKTCGDCGHRDFYMSNGGSLPVGFDAAALVEHVKEDVAANAPTCTEDGNDAYTVCTLCNKVLAGSNAPVPATGHNFQFSEVVEATCTTFGYRLVFCACGFNIADLYTPELGHINAAGKVFTNCEDVKNPDGTPGDALCVRCDNEIHDMETLEVDPTCKDHGYTVEYCLLCGWEGDETVIPKPDDVTDLHDYEKTAEVAPTFDDKGSKTYTCKICGDSYSEEIPVLDASDRLVFDYTINHAKEDLEITDEFIVNGGLLALTIKTTADQVDMYSSLLKIAYNADALEFVSGKLDNTEKFDEDNCEIYGNDELLEEGNTNATLSVLVVAKGDKATLDKAEAFVTVYFRVLDKALETGIVFTSITDDAEQVCETVTKDGKNVDATYEASEAVAAMSAITNPEFEGDFVHKLGDVSIDTKVSLADLTVLLDYIANDYYCSEADIDRDGEVTIFDLAEIKDFLAGKQSYAEMVA